MKKNCTPFDLNYWPRSPNISPINGLALARVGLDLNGISAAQLIEIAIASLDQYTDLSLARLAGESLSFADLEECRDLMNEFLLAQKIFPASPLEAAKKIALWMAERVNAGFMDPYTTAQDIVAIFENYPRSKQCKYVYDESSSAIRNMYGTLESHYDCNYETYPNYPENALKQVAARIGELWKEYQQKNSA